MPKVYVFCPDHNKPSGGTMKLYELVDTLNANGMESFIVHTDKEFRITWFPNSTRLTDFYSLIIYEDDLLIYPEIYGEDIIKYWPGVRKIIFNQNSFYALRVFDEKPHQARNVYLHPDIIQVIVVSDYDFELFTWLFPNIKLSKITYGINEELFHFTSAKKMQIAVIPRKLPADYIFLDNLLKMKDELGEFKIKLIEQISYQECAEILRESMIFLSFSSKEGFGLPPAEAMACGCIVIGYHGLGGKEFFKNELTFSIEPWDMMNYAQQIIKVIKQFEENKTKTFQIGKSASEFILKKYSLSNQEKSILNIIKPLLNLV